MIGPRPDTLTPRSYAFPSTESRELANGLRVMVAPLHRVPIATVLYTVRAGASDEPAQDAGQAMLTAQALAEGSLHQSADDLALTMESLGGELQVGAMWTHAEVGATVLASRLPAAMERLAEVVQQPAFPVDGIERLRAERQADLLQQRSEPRGLADDLFADACCGSNDRNGLPAGGTAQSIARLTPDTVRSYYTRAYLPHRSLLIVTGDVEPAQVLSLAETSWAGWRTGPSSSMDPSRVEPPQPAVLIAHREGASQTELRLGHRGVPRTHPDFHALSMMNAILGGLFNSRINLNLREAHAYTYGAFSSFDWRRDTSLFVVSTAVRTDVTGAALGEIRSEIDRIRQEPVTEAELSLARDYLVGVFPLRFETTAAIADAIAFRHHFDLPGAYYDEYRDRMAAVTTDDIQRVAQTHLRPESFQTVAVGDASAIREALTNVAGQEPRIINS